METFRCKMFSTRTRGLFSVWPLTSYVLLGKVNLEKPLHLVIGSITPTSVLLSWGNFLKTPFEGNIMNDCLEDGWVMVNSQWPVWFQLDVAFVSQSFPWKRPHPIDHRKDSSWKVCSGVATIISIRLHLSDRYFNTYCKQAWPVQTSWFCDVINNSSTQCTEVITFSEEVGCGEINLLTTAGVFVSWVRIHGTHWNTFPLLRTFSAYVEGFFPSWTGRKLEKILEILT